jgi:hypothetical protein
VTKKTYKYPKTEGFYEFKTGKTYQDHRGKATENKPPQLEKIDQESQKRIDQAGAG